MSFWKTGQRLPVFIGKTFSLRNCPSIVKCIEGFRPLRKTGYSALRKFRMHQRNIRAAKVLSCYGLAKIISLLGCIFLSCNTFGDLAFSQVVNPTRGEKVRLDTSADVRRKLEPLLQKYCGEGCEIVSIDVKVDESLPDMEDLGFEGSTSTDLNTTFTPSRVVVGIQIDDRITASNRERIQSILLNHIRSLGVTGDVIWQPVRIPQVGAAANVDEQLKRNLHSRVSQALNEVIAEYCPEECVISQLLIDGKLIAPDEAGSLPPTRVLRDETTGGVVRIDEVKVEMGIDEKIPVDERARIAALAKAKIKFVSPVVFDVTSLAFPESFAKKRERQSETAKDPYGLEKLRETLKIFRELAGTKEIITSTANTTASTNLSATQNTERESRSNSETSLTEKNSKEQNSQNSTSSNSSMSSLESAVSDWAPYIFGFIIVGGIVMILVMRLSKAKQDAKIMVEAAESMKRLNQRDDRRDGTNARDRRRDWVPPPPNGMQQPDMPRPWAPYEGNVVLKAGNPPPSREEAALLMKKEELKQEILQEFMHFPKVAKETLKKILIEEGVEETGKLVHLFGEVIVYELLNETSLRKELIALSEFYANSNFNFTLQQEIEQLQRLRIKCTAAEIRVLSSKSSDKYDFLNKMDAGQIYNLIKDEKPQVQSIVLTQIDHQKRMTVFDMFEGMGKVNLMSELSRADAIPKEYLFNVAQALGNKVRTSPEFDTEQVRSSEILLDLMEKSDLFQQRELMRTLQAQNPETSRAIKMKLVTLETLPFLKSGILIELILGLDRKDLVTFLVGAKDQTRGLLLSKAPPELAESWMEEIQSAGMVDDASYRLVELKLLNRIRSFATSGVVNLLQVNDVIFHEKAGFNQEAGGQQQQQTMGKISKHAMVA